MFRQCKIESNSPADACAIPKKIANPITIALRADRINRHSLLRRRNPQQTLVSESKWRLSRIKSEKGAVDRKTMRAFGLSGFPNLVVIDRTGRVRLTHTGYNNSETSFRRDLTQLLQSL
jgi:hypothetical protein